MMKLCRDCKHCATASNAPEFWKCFAPANKTGTSVVDGNPMFRARFCDQARADIFGHCGPDGNWFEAKEGA